MQFDQDQWNKGIETRQAIFRESFWRPQPIITVSEAASQNRILPNDSPFPGPWRNDKTPYLVEIMDNMSPYSGVEHEVVVKGTQLGLTAAAENVGGFWMDVVPAKILFTSATQDLLEQWSTGRLDKMIDSWGKLRKKIFSQSETKAAKRSGDTTFMKEFYGGSIRLASAQSSPSLRSSDIRILIRDEIDGAPRQLRTGEGDWMAVSMARTDAWKSRKKIMDFSTPTTFIESSIWPEYERGDQRKYFVPCPRCNTMQALEFGHGWGHENPHHGMQWHRDLEIQHTDLSLDIGQHVTLNTRCVQ
jgi:phage terminase large subunit GpA-like protein